MGGMHWKVFVDERMVDCIRANNQVRAHAEAVKKWWKYKPGKAIRVTALNAK